MIAEQIADGSVSVIGPVTDSSSLIGPDVALVGDSCHSVTPTFGFGANLAISDSIALSKAMDAGNGDIAEGLKCYNEDWFPHVDSIMSLEKVCIFSYARLPGKILILCLLSVSLASQL